MDAHLLFDGPAGERVPLDGRVTEGASAVNQAPITGESVPVEKQSGAEVFAGTINGDGTLTVEATKTVADTTLARITKSIKNYSARPANALLNRTGHPFWQDESYDRWVRDRNELSSILEEWHWSSDSQ